MMAAREADRYDEFEKNSEGEYEDDALHYFNVFRDGINEAYHAVSRQWAKPDTRELVRVSKDGSVDLTEVYPDVYTIKQVLTADGTQAVDYEFVTRTKIQTNATPGSKVLLYYHYIPDRLTKLKDAPEFSDALVDPMVYVSLAVSRMWASEKKLDLANYWLQQHYGLLRDVVSSLKNPGSRRIPRRRFR